jgi:hypothetical protein
MTRKAAQMAKRKTADEVDSKGYRLAPIDLNATRWMYEGADGVDVYANEKGVIMSTLLPWETLCDLVDNHRKIMKAGK